MENVWLASALWLGPALLASVISIRVAMSVALVEIMVGAIRRRRDRRVQSRLADQSTNEAEMNAESDDLRILRLHKTWADRYILLWQLFILLLFGGIYLFLDRSGIDAAERAGAFVLLAAMVLVAAVWQAVGLGVARVHMLLRGIDLEARAARGARLGRWRS